MKHLLNNLSEEEKNSIREQHTDKIEIDTSKFKTLVESKLGDVKLIAESETLYLYGQTFNLYTDSVENKDTFLGQVRVKGSPWNPPIPEIDILRNRYPQRSINLPCSFEKQKTPNVYKPECLITLMSMESPEDSYLELSYSKIDDVGASIMKVYSERLKGLLLKKYHPSTPEQQILRKVRYGNRIKKK